MQKSIPGSPPCEVLTGEGTGAATTGEGAGATTGCPRTGAWTVSVNPTSAMS